MKAFRKVSLLIAAVLVLVLLLAACSGNDNGTATPPAATPGNEAPPPPPPAAEDPTAAEAPTEDEAPRRFGAHEPRDLGGRTILAGNWWSGTIPFSAFDWDEPDPATAGNYFMARLIWDNAQRVYAEYNFNIEEIILSYDEMLPTLTSSILAGAPFADIVLLGGGMQLSAIMGDLIMPLDHIDLPGSDILGPQIYGQVLTEAFGYRWSFWDNRPEVNSHFIVVNLDIINAIGAPNPVDLYNRGQWTWDNMLEIMRLATRDTTGDGVIDQWGIAAQPGDIVSLAVGANDGRIMTDDRQYWMDHPATIEAFEFMEVIFREGLWQYDPVLGMDVGDWGRNFFAWQDGQSALGVAATWSMNNGDLPFEFAAVPFPLGPSNTSGRVGLTGAIQGLTFPHGSSWDAVDILRVVEEFMFWPGDEPELMLEDGLGWPRGIYLTEEDVQRVAALGRNFNVCISMNVPQYNWIFGGFVQHFADQSMTVLQAVETYRGLSQERLDNFFN
ncbi:MAG: extracellular solute-binding protein [Firmicutes bacterium]|nr:extracellular solute-binding protein [Bacillota bacterium]